MLITQKGLYVPAKYINTAHLINNYVSTHITEVRNAKHEKSIENYKTATVQNVPYVRLPILALEDDDIIATINNGQPIKNIIPVGVRIPAERLASTLVSKPNQVVVLKYLMTGLFTDKRANDGLAAALIDMATGQGKTYLTGAIISELKVKTVIVLRKSALSEWTAMFEKYFPKLIVGVYHGTLKKNKECDVMLINIENAVKDHMVFEKKKPVKKTGKKAGAAEPVIAAPKALEPKLVPPNAILLTDYFKTFGLTVFEEVHDYATETRSEVFWKFNTRYRLGISATPERKADGMETIYYQHLGDPIVTANLEGYEIGNNVWPTVVCKLEYSGPPEFTKEFKNVNDIPSPVLMDKQYANDPYRNALIATIAEMEHRNGRSVFIFASTRKHVYLLASLIRSPTAVLLGGILPEAYSRAILKPIVITTYAYGVQSISIVPMSVGIWATSRLDTKLAQTIGRLTREGSDRSIIRHIYDIVDVNTSTKKQYRSRLELYKSRKQLVITQHEVEWSQVEFLASERLIDLHGKMMETEAVIRSLADDELVDNVVEPVTLAEPIAPSLINDFEDQD